MLSRIVSTMDNTCATLAPAGMNPANPVDKSVCFSGVASEGSGGRKRMADYEATPDLVGKLKKGQMLVIQATNLAATAISFPLPLADTSGNSFQKANEDPPTDPKVFEERQKREKDPNNEFYWRRFTN
jgi:hypothetical protein